MKQALLLLCLAVPLAALHPAQALQLPFLGAFKSAVYRQVTVADVLRDEPVNALVLVIGRDKPQRRQPYQPSLSFSPAAAAAVPQGVQVLLQKGVRQVEQLHGASLYALQVDVLPHVTRRSSKEPGTLPLVVYDLSSGRLWLSTQLLQALQSMPVQVFGMLTHAAEASLKHLLQATQQAMPSSLDQLISLLPQAAAAGLALAIGAAAVPKWFCFVCPIVLGLLAPLVINAGVGEAANLACKSMDLPDDECVQLWFTALALGMILSLLSAIPIYKVCRLYECAHPSPNSTLSAV